MNEGTGARSSGLGKSDLRSRYQAWWRDVIKCQECLSGNDGPSLTAERDAAVFFPLPNLGVMPAPLPVRFLLVGSEPSAGWARNTAEARAMVVGTESNPPFRNFNEQRSDWLFQYAIERWLIDAAHEAYVLSDVAKCALSLKTARATPSRYEICLRRWFAAELNLLGNPSVVAVGDPALDALRRHWLPSPRIRIFDVPHPSGSNRGHLYRKWLPDEAAGQLAILSEVPSDLAAFVTQRRRLSRQTQRGSGDFVPTDGDRRFLTAYRAAFTDLRAQLHLTQLA